MKKYILKNTLKGNDLSEIVSDIVLPKIVSTFRDNLVVASLVYSDFSGAMSEAGETIKIELPVVFGEADDFIEAVGVDTANTVVRTAKITINSHKAKEFALTDRDLVRIQKEMIVPNSVEGAIKSVATSVEKAVLNTYKKIGTFNVKSADASKSLSAGDLTSASTVLFDKECPDSYDKFLVATASRVEELDNFLTEKGVDVNQGSVALRTALNAGGMLKGYYVFKSRHLPRHTQGTAYAETLKLASAYTAGDLEVVLTNATDDITAVTFKDGDIFTVTDAEGVVHQFAVDGDQVAAAATKAVKVKYAAKSDLEVDTAAAYVVAGSQTFDVNIAFAKDYAALVVRSLVDEVAMLENSGASVLTYVDPVSGIPLKLEMFRNSKTGQNFWRFEILFGTDVVYPELATLVLPKA